MTTKYILDETRMPKAWYNIQADFLEPMAPVLHPATKEPVGPADLEPLFARALIEQEVSTEREIEIPEPVREVYRLWRPAPLYRAHGLKRRWVRRRRSSTSTRASARQVATSPTRRSPGVL